MMGGPLLVAIDTATRRAAIALGSGSDMPLARRSWEAGYRHGEELLAVLDELLREAAIGLGDVSGVVVGTGPGAFTGLRVGMATAKGLAYGLHIPLVGVGSAAALALAARTERDAPDRGVAVLMPAGPHDRYLARFAASGGGGDVRPSVVGNPELVPGAEPLEPLCGAMTVVAVDLAAGPGISEEAVALGLAAQAGLGAALLDAGREALAQGGADDVAELVPAYVTLPRGITAPAGTIEWSRDLR
jgi:tRNA threonylcarbamoyl adenosine modification protein YeaZ